MKNVLSSVSPALVDVRSFLISCYQMVHAFGDCLYPRFSKNIYHEARGEHTAGMRAVADVVMNRVKAIQFPNNICEVVKQGPVYESWKTKRFPDLPDEQRIYNPRKGKCQFSWYCDGKPDVPVDSVTWEESYRLAQTILEAQASPYWTDFTEGALWYHADYVHPYWADSLNKTSVIDNHIFYK